MEPSILNLNREIVLNDYNSAANRNKELFLKGCVKASSEYIYDNQKEDANTICNKFYETSIRCISIVKRTKVGMDGLMIELAKLITTHPDDNFVLHRNNVFFITAMMNVLWQDDLKDKMPACFKDNVYHHGKLQRLKTKLKGLKNAIIIIDEIDSGDKEEQKLHLILKESGILDMKYMEENNIRFVFVSATIINELRDLYKWGNKHYTHYMIIPDNYIGHKEFLDRGIIQEYYPIKDVETAEKWIQEDILENYGSDYRVHLVRTDVKNIDLIWDACIKHGIIFKNHTSDDRISHEELSYIFNDDSNHVVIAVKGFYRRANLIPNIWKMKIGATHERYVKKYDTNVQVQGFPGRMTGYWKQELLEGHKTGPHRTSIDAINEYEEFYQNPFGKTKYSTSSKTTFVNKKHIENLESTEIPEIKNGRVPIVINIDETIIKTFKTTRINKTQIAIDLLTRYHSTNKEFMDVLQNGKCFHISTPSKDTKRSYDMHINGPLRAVERNIPLMCMDRAKECKETGWQMYCDEKNNKLVVLWQVFNTEHMTEPFQKSTTQIARANAGGGGGGGGNSSDEEDD